MTPQKDTWINKEKGIWNYVDANMHDVRTAYLSGNFNKVKDYLAQHQDLAQYLNKKYKGIHFYRNYDDMLESDNIDAVIVCTPHYSHPRLAIEAIEKGKKLGNFSIVNIAPTLAKLMGFEMETAEENSVL